MADGMADGPPSTTPSAISHEPSAMMTRRSFLAAAALAPALSRLQPPSSEARLTGSVPLYLPGRPATPLERLVGAGLDARLSTDLSTLGASPPSAMVTPNDRYYVRTSAPVALDAAAAATPWSVAIRGRVAAPAALAIADVERLAVSVGPYVMECAGNADPTAYGLLSAASWDGAPMDAVIDRVKPSAAA